MSASIPKTLITGAIFTAVLGVLFHSAFDFIGRILFFAPFLPVNESVWEHLKLLYFPAVIWLLICYFRSGKNIPNYLSASVWGILHSLILIPVLFYTYSGILGRSIVLVDVLIYMLGVAFCYYVISISLTSFPTVCNLPFHRKSATPLSNTSSVLILFIIAILFIVFTFMPPHIALFCDKTTGSYGL